MPWVKRRFSRPTSMSCGGLFVMMRLMPASQQMRRAASGVRTAPRSVTATPERLVRVARSTITEMWGSGSASSAGECSRCGATFVGNVPECIEKGSVHAAVVSNMCLTIHDFLGLLMSPRRTSQCSGLPQSFAAAVSRTGGSRRSKCSRLSSDLGRPGARLRAAQSGGGQNRLVLANSDGDPLAKLRRSVVPIRFGEPLNEAEPSVTDGDLARCRQSLDLGALRSTRAMHSPTRPLGASRTVAARQATGGRRQRTRCWLLCRQP